MSAAKVMTGAELETLAVALYESRCRDELARRKAGPSMGYGDYADKLVHWTSVHPATRIQWRQRALDMATEAAAVIDGRVT